MTAGTAGSGDYYARRLATPEYRQSREAKAEVIAHVLGPLLTEATWIADIGCGTGIMKKALETYVGKAIVGFEIDLAFIVERERVVGADAYRLPVSDGAFDLLIINHIYEHVPDPGRLFAEVRRVLAPGGHAYVSAGSRWAVVEPHYRLPFLSWLPRRAADRYLRWSGRGETYDGVRFLGYGALLRVMRGPGIEIHDVTEDALRGLVGPQRGRAWRPVWGALRRLPAPVRNWLLRGSPQWFFILERSAGEGGRELETEPGPPPSG